MKIKTSELSGPALDWAVAKCEGYIDDSCSWLYAATVEDVAEGSYHPSVDWSIAGPIIEREEISLIREWSTCGHQWWGFTKLRPLNRAYGGDQLIAFMRCYVDCKLGSEVEIPEELLK